MEKRREFVRAELGSANVHWFNGLSTRIRTKLKREGFELANVALRTFVYPAPDADVSVDYGLILDGRMGEEGVFNLEFRISFKGHGMPEFALVYSRQFANARDGRFEPRLAISVRDTSIAEITGRSRRHDRFLQAVELLSLSTEGQQSIEPVFARAYLDAIINFMRGEE